MTMKSPRDGAHLTCAGIVFVLCVLFVLFVLFGLFVLLYLRYVFICGKSA
jgi:hypothetical protein